MQAFTAATPLPPYLPYPRFLLDIPVNETAKLVYILILGRIQLSQSQGWVDPDGQVYCRYPVKTLAGDLGKSKSTVVSALSDLEKQGLLHRHRDRLGYASKLYLRIPENCSSECQKTVSLYAGKLAPNKNNYNKNNYSKSKRNPKGNYDYAYKGDSL